MSRKISKRKVRNRKPRKRASKTYGKIVLTIFVLTILFIVSMFSFTYLKGLLDNTTKFIRADSVRLNEEIDEIDKELKGLLSHYDIPSRNITKSKVKKIEKGNLKWEYKENSIKLVDGINRYKFLKDLKEIIKNEDTKVQIKEKKSVTLVSINVFGARTHLIHFNKPKTQTVSSFEKLKTADKPIKEEKKSKETVIGKKQDIPKVIIIIDDVGLDKYKVDEIMKIDTPINIAVLPYLPYSEYAANKAKQKGIDVLLHLPMEPKESSGYSAEDAGEGVLRVGYSKEQIEYKLVETLKSVPHIIGVNNHMGSKFTENKELMEIVMKNLKTKDLLFIDSLTSHKSYGYSTAKSIGVKTLKRDLFIDNSTKSKEHVKNQLDALVKLAYKNGMSVGICHTYNETIEVLSEYLPKINKKVDFVAIRSVLN